jgi:hypothetical protein
MVSQRMLKIIRSKETSKINGDNLNNVRCKASWHFRNKEREYLKNKIKELAMNRKNKNLRDCIEEYMNLRGATNLPQT